MRLVLEDDFIFLDSFEEKYPMLYLSVNYDWELVRLIFKPKLKNRSFESQ